jgi:hypothetical protein
VTEHIGGHRLEVFQINGKFKLTFDQDQPIPADLLARTPGILLASPLIVSKWKKKIPRVPLCWCSILITTECRIKQSLKAVASSSNSSSSGNINNSNINNNNISNYKLNNNIKDTSSNNLSSYLRNNNFNTLNNNNSCSNNNNSSSSNSNNTNSSFTKTSNPRNSKLPHNQ